MEAKVKKLILITKMDSKMELVNSPPALAVELILPSINDNKILGELIEKINEQITENINA